jgi:hypothetical protein
MVRVVISLYKRSCRSVPLSLSVVGLRICGEDGSKIELDQAEYTVHDLPRTVAAR